MTWAQWWDSLTITGRNGYAPLLRGEIVKTLTGWEKVEKHLESALCVAFDDCHKIYLAMDEVEYLYFTLNKWTTVTGSPLEMLEQVQEWYDVESCSLRFVSAVESGEFTTLIEQ